MKTKFALLALAAAFLFTLPAHADSDPIVLIDASNIGLGSTDLNMSFEYDPTTNQIVPNTLSIVFSTTALGQFSASSVSSSVMNFSNSEGDLLQIDSVEFFLFNTNGGTFPQPEPTSYPFFYVDIVCGFFTGDNLTGPCDSTIGPGFTNADSGTLIVSGIPEPQTLTMIGIGLLALMLTKLRRRSLDS
jgi:hypothetical protein